MSVTQHIDLSSLMPCSLTRRDECLHLSGSRSFPTARGAAPRANQMATPRMAFRYWARGKQSSKRRCSAVSAFCRCGTPVRTQTCIAASMASALLTLTLPRTNSSG